MPRLKENVSHKKNDKIPTHISSNVAQKEIFDQNGNDKFVFISIKNIQYKYECLSDWSKNQIKQFWEFNNRVHKMKWQDVYASASKGKDKRGLAYTIIAREKYKSISFIKDLSKEIDMFELRVDEEIRVHGFRDKSIFYLCVLDRNHKITK